MKILYTIILSLLLLTSTNSYSQQQIPHYVNGKTLLEMLNGNSGQKLIATGYVAGAMDILVATGAANICDYKAMTVDQIENTTKMMLTAAPQFLNGAASVYIAAAMRHHYACEKKQNDPLNIPKEKIFQL